MSDSHSSQHHGLTTRAVFFANALGPVAITQADEDTTCWCKYAGTAHDQDLCVL